MSENWDLLFKLIVIGDTGTGKSCLLHSFLNSSFKRGSAHTIGVEFGAKIIEVGGKRVKLQIWDTAGQERFKAVTRSYYRGAAGAIIVYDLSNRKTYEHCGEWLQDARDLASSGVVTALVGNKCDLQDEREVTYLEGSILAQQNDMLFLEASALNGDSVHEVFLKCARTVLQRLQDDIIDLDQVSIVTPQGAKANTSIVAPNADTAKGSSSLGCC
ncbi:ras family-domain-containing protein [Baffinella frigidus]|nr:ras family-domain-containing protein [Cryptophyta sp. CCMP2293]|mmetsp:Transcript_45635/g.108884  ORF Transcript_45635/g.108884 Transcript_45635/m.108884 type:complete len:215 (-) Transcript_45635:159-803(-)